MRWLAGGHVLDVSTGAARRAEIGIEAGRIVAVGPGFPGRRPDDDVLDVTGAWVLPGLIDCHVHLTQPTDAGDPAAAARRSDAAVALFTAAAAERTVRAGITTVRDVGGWNYVEMAVRDEIEAGRRCGPRMFLAGRLLSITTATVAYYPGMYDVADGPEAVRAAVRRQLAQGADVIKVMATGALLSSPTEDATAIQFALDELEAAVAVAHAARKPVAAHAHALAGIHNAVSAGVDSIEHATFADDEVLTRMAAAGTVLVPTLCAGELLFRDAAVAAGLPPHLRDRMAELHERHAGVIRRAHELGVTIAMGTDAGTPGNHHGLNATECVLLHEQSGLPPEAAIRAATVEAARLLRREGELGCLAPGAHADVIALRADPRADLTELTRVAVVVKGGEVVRDDLASSHLDP